MLLIKRHLTDTNEQLTRDFGEYPINCFSNKQERYSQFFITRTTPLNRKIYDWILVFRGILNREIISPEADSKYVDSMKLKSEVKKKLQRLTNESTKSISLLFRTAAGAKTILGRIANFFVLALLTPVLLIPFIVVIAMLIVVIFYAPLRLLFRLAPTLFGSTLSSNTIGGFLPVTYSGKLEIVINKGFRQLKTQPTYDEVISHEHIHLLQYLYFSHGKVYSRNHDAFRESKKESLINCLKNPEKDLESLKYYFNIDEMEARLHEVVLSFYRENGSLPKSFHEYVKMLSAADSGLGAMATRFLTEHDNPSTSPVKPYVIRCNQVQLAIGKSILNLKDEITMRRYLLEALPIMYANLLVLYGYVDEAISFLETVQCIDLFEELYGISAMPIPLRSRLEHK